MENNVSLYASKYCTTWMCAVEKLIYNDQIVLQLHRSKQSSPGITQQWHTAVLMWPSYFIYQHKYQQTYQIMGCFDTGKLSDSETEKRLRNGPFAENARLQCLARVHHALERSAPDNLPGWCAACWSHRPAARGPRTAPGRRSRWPKMSKGV